mgnify:CR=1 FL=1
MSQAKRVLIAEDSSVIQNLTRKILEAQQYQIAAAKNGEQVLQMLAKDSYDVLLLDINMPVMDGMECMKEIRADTTLHQPKIIFCTTENEFSKIQLAIMNGADEYVMKPFDETIIAGKMVQLGIIDEAH